MKKNSALIRNHRSLRREKGGGIAGLVILVIGEIRLILEEKQTIIALGVCVRHKITDQGMAVMESEKEPGISL